MKRRPALLQLSCEHHAALVLAKRIAAADGADAIAAQMRSTAEVFARELEPHFQAEEADLLPRLVAAGETAIVEQTLAEHRLLRDLAARIASGDTASLKPFGIALHDHVRFEERLLFVTAEATLPASYLDDPGSP